MEAQIAEIRLPVAPSWGKSRFHNKSFRATGRLQSAAGDEVRTQPAGANFTPRASVLNPTPGPAPDDVALAPQNYGQGGGSRVEADRFLLGVRLC